MRIKEKIKHHLSVASYMIKMELMAQMEYPAFLVGWFLSNILQFAVGIGTLWVVTVRFSGINGWDFGQIAFLYGIGIISHGLTVILFIQTWAIDYFVVHGQFDRMLLRPMGVFFQYITGTLNLIGLTDLLPGLIIFFAGAAATGFPWSVGNIALLATVIAGAVLIRGGIYMMVGSAGFWTKKSWPMIEVTTGLFDKIMMYPVSIYNYAIQALFTFLFPVAFISFYPASYFLGKETLFRIPGVVPLWTLAAGILVITAGHICFRAGMRRYDSAGS